MAKVICKSAVAEKLAPVVTFKNKLLFVLLQINFCVLPETANACEFPLAKIAARLGVPAPTEPLPASKVIVAISPK